MTRSKLVDEVERLNLNRLEVLTGADRGDPALWILPGKVRGAVVVWSMFATGHDDERGAWSKLHGAHMTGPKEHHRALFGPRHNRIPSNPDFLRVLTLADGESFRDLEAGRTLTAKTFSAPLNPPVEEEGTTFTELHGGTIYETAVTFTLDDVYVDPLTKPTRNTGVEWHDEAVGRARDIARKHPAEFCPGGEYNASALAEALTVPRPVDGLPSIGAAEGTVRNLLNKRRAELAE